MQNCRHTWAGVQNKCTFLLGDLENFSFLTRSSKYHAAVTARNYFSTLSLFLRVSLIAMEKNVTNASNYKVGLLISLFGNAGTVLKKSPGLPGHSRRYQIIIRMQKKLFSYHLYFFLCFDPQMVRWWAMSFPRIVQGRLLDWISLSKLFGPIFIVI